MGSSNENPKNSNIVSFYNFQMGKENKLEVPPKAKDYQISVGENSEQLFEIEVEEAKECKIDEKEGTISFAHEKGIKTGKIKDFQDVKARREREKAKQKASGEMTI